jgi:DNA polymerase I-like protein with 3'-5' exonuclease and polymerase domains
LFDILSQGKDFHNFNTAIFFDLNVDEPGFKKKYAIEREVGKEVALALMYGAGVNRLMESAQKRGFVWTKGQARYKLDRFKEFYEGVYKFKYDVLDPLLVAGETVPNILGRPIKFDDPSEVHMKGFNKLMQGGASDLVLNSGNKAQQRAREAGIDAHLQVFEHDALISEVREEQAEAWSAILTHAMTDYELISPLGRIELKVEGAIADCWQK